MYLNTPGVEWIHTTEATIVASIFAAISILISVIHIMQHLSHYTMPAIQIYVIRILIICPVYATSSALAVGLGKNGQYAEVARDVYEAFVIYSFLSLILEYCGGETDCVYQIENEPMLKMPCPLCFMKPKQRDARLIRTLKRGVLQFVIIKPIFAVIDIVMIAIGEYYNLPYQFFEMFVYNISYTWALYCMYLFYVATNKIIKKFHPILKFASVKMIVFATYYQSLLVKASSMSPENAIMWNDLLLCIEMVVFATCLMLAFPTSEFQGGLPDSRLMNNVRDVLKIKDVVQDVYHNFMPVYQEYTLQRSEKEAPETVRVKTYLAGNLDSVAIEMSHRYRGRNKRFAFNSLLRGDTPIRAQLRSRSTHFDNEEGKEKSVLESDSECDDVGEQISSTEHEQSLYETFMMTQQQSNWIRKHSVAGNGRSMSQSESSDDELGSSSDCLTANVRHSHVFLDENQDIDVETGTMLSTNKPNVLFQHLNPIEMDIYQRRVNFMKTHGIGMIVTDHGVEVRPASFCPSEEESVVNVDFMNKNLHKLDHFSTTTSPSYVLPDENLSAVVLPRITSSKKKGKEAKEHQKRVESAVRQEEMLLQVPPSERKNFPLTSTSGSSGQTTPNRTPVSSSDNLQGLEKGPTVVESDEKEAFSDAKQIKLDKMKLLPPITAISAPRQVLTASKPTKKAAAGVSKKAPSAPPRVQKREGHVVYSETETDLVQKASRGASESSDDWGDFQVNESTEYSTPATDVGGSASGEYVPVVECDDSIADTTSMKKHVESHASDSHGSDSDSSEAVTNPMFSALKQEADCDDIRKEKETDGMVG